MSFSGHFLWKSNAFGDSVHPVSFAITIICLIAILVIFEFSGEIGQIEAFSLHFSILKSTILARNMTKMYEFIMVFTSFARRYAFWNVRHDSILVLSAC